jgi:hypothetical protein
VGAATRGARVRTGGGGGASSAGLAETRTLAAVGPVACGAGVAGGTAAELTLIALAWAAGGGRATGVSPSGDWPSQATTPSPATAAIATASVRISGTPARAAGATGIVAAACAASTLAALGEASGAANAATVARDRRGRPCIIDDGDTTWTLM